MIESPSLLIIIDHSPASTDFHSPAEVAVEMLDTVVETVVEGAAASFHTDTAHLMGVGGMRNFADTTVAVGTEVEKVTVVDMTAGVEVVEDKNVVAAEVAVVQVVAVVTNTERIQTCPG